jgi:protein-L-isoaspartate(D-aspartate) O-methyltransferase
MTEQNFREMRRAMVASQLRTTGVSDPAVVAAMGAVPRERFVPRECEAVAYADFPVPLAPGRDLNPPMALGKLLSEARPRPGERALVVGAGTGYAAAVLARLVGPVTALEEDPGLAATARAALAGSDVTLVEGPLAKGWKKGAPYDLILIDGAVESLPDAIVAQLADGGRIATGLIEDGVGRLCLGRKAGDGFGLVAFADAAASILPGFDKPRPFIF